MLCNTIFYLYNAQYNSTLFSKIGKTIFTSNSYFYSNSIYGNLVVNLQFCPSRYSLTALQL